MGTPPESRDLAGGDERERPPILGRWSRLYAIVIGALVLEILLLVLLTRGCR